MKKYRFNFILLFSILTVISGLPSTAQSTWFPVNPMPAQVGYFDVAFAGSKKAWAVGEEGTILHTMDGGLTMERQFCFTDNDLYCIYFVDSLTGWIGGHYYNFFHTEDGGNNWFRIPFEEYYLYELFFIDQTTGWAGTYSQILKTEDGGYNWILMLDDLIGRPIKMVFPDHEHGYVVTEASMLYSTSDGGMNWDTISFSGSVLYDIFCFDAEHGWMASGDGTLFHSIDGWQTWDTMVMTEDDNIRKIHFYNDQRGIAVTSTFCWITEDGGQSWEMIDHPGSIYSPAIGFGENGSVWMVGESIGSISSSDYGNTWTVFKTNLESDLNAVTWASGNRAFAVGEQGIIVFSEDDGKTWQEHGFITDKYLGDIVFTTPDEGWIVGSAILLHTTDGGISWEEMETFTTHTMRSLFFLDEQSGFVCGSYGRVFKTLDGGTSWENISTNISQHLFDVFFFDPDNGIVVGEEERYLFTHDGGITWTANDIGIMYDYYDVYFTNDQTGFLAAREGLYRSVDGGVSWSLHWEDDGFYSPFFQSIHFVDSLNGWASGKNGYLIHTRDGGEHWAKHLQVTDRDLYDVHFLNPEMGIAVGEDGIIMRTEQGSYLAPGIITPLADTFYCSEEPIILQTDVIGDSLTFTWYFADEVIPGADSSNLIFDPIQPENGGVYWYEAWNRAGIAENESFIISVRPRAEVVASPHDTTVHENDTLILNQAVVGALPISYQWQKNGQDIPGANFHIYPIYGVQLSDSGAYRCIVSNDCAIDTTEAAQLTVLPASHVDDLNDLRISIQPNPVNDYCIIHFGQEITEGEYRIYDTKGTVIMNGELRSSKSISIYVESLDPGIYFFRIGTSGNSTSLNFIKQ